MPVYAAIRPALPLRDRSRIVRGGRLQPARGIVVTIFSTRHIHPDAVTYFCDDARTYEAVEDSADRAIAARREWLRLSNSMSDHSAMARPGPREGRSVSTRFPLSGPSIPTMRSAGTVESLTRRTPDVS